VVCCYILNVASVAIGRSDKFKIQCAVVLEPRELESKYVKALGKLLCESILAAFAKARYTMMHDRYFCTQQSVNYLSLLACPLNRGILTARDASRQI
jgi:hypothetical protein